MDVQPQDPDEVSVPSTESAPPGMPRWAKVLGIVTLLLLLVFVLLHLTGRGLGGHMHSHSRSTAPPQDSGPR